MADTTGMPSWATSAAPTSAPPSTTWETSAGASLSAAARAISAWQGQIGINLDEEMTSLMAIERSYQATARLMSTVDQMFQAILRATGAL